MEQVTFICELVVAHIGRFALRRQILSRSQHSHGLIAFFIKQMEITYLVPQVSANGLQIGAVKIPQSAATRGGQLLSLAM